MSGSDSEEEPTESVVVRRKSAMGAPPSSGMSKKAGNTAVAGPSSGLKLVLKRPAPTTTTTDIASEESTESDEESGREAVANEGKPKTPRRKRRFRLTDSIAKAKRRAERKAQAAQQSVDKSEESDHSTAAETEETDEKPPEVPKPSIRSYNPMQLLADFLLRKFLLKDPEEYFAFPVTPSIAPDYASVIKNPMDFSTMRQKIEENAYPDVDSMRMDVELIISNALLYNQPNTVYYLAAQKLSTVSKYLFGEQYLRYLLHSLPFAHALRPEQLGLPTQIPIARTVSPALLNRPTPPSIVDQPNPVTIQQENPHLASRLAARKPKAHLAFLNQKEGTTCLRIVTGNGGEAPVVLGDLVPPLESGNPGVLVGNGLVRMPSVVPISYLDYGPYASFAPQFESTWANLNKTDSDLLLSTYGDVANVINVMNLRQMVADSGEHMIKMVDDILDDLTDNEHSKTIGQLEGKDEDSNNNSVENLIKNVSSLSNLGLDVSYLRELRAELGLKPGEEEQKMANMLEANSQRLSDLSALQNQRLSQPPPMTLIDALPPGLVESELAVRTLTELGKMANDIHPSQLVSTTALHEAMGMADPDVDLDLFQEFFAPQ